jgi:hypothetical protein
VVWIVGRFDSAAEVAGITYIPSANPLFKNRLFTFYFKDLALSCFERTFPQSKHGMISSIKSYGYYLKKLYNKFFFVAEAIRFVQDELSSYVLASVAPLVFEDHSADFVDAREVCLPGNFIQLRFSSMTSNYLGFWRYKGARSLDAKC